MRSPGRWWLLLVAPLLFAGSLKVRLQQNPIHRGEPATLVIEAEGDDIELPHIERIAGYPIAGSALAESVVMRDGEYVVKKSLSLRFYPDKNVTIEPIEAKIDGEVHKSEPIALGVIQKIPKNKYVTFTLRADKKEAYVGEPVIADLELKIRRGLDIVNYDFIPPKFEGFWVRELNATNRYLEEHGEYLIKRLKLLLLPQKSGFLRVGGAVFKYAVPVRAKDSFGFSIVAPKWKSVVSNPLEFVVKPLPKEGIDLVGDFKMKVAVDKNRTKPNEPVRLTLTISGEGNVENFGPVKLDIPGATVYEDEPQSKMTLKNGKILASYTQRFTIIADRSFTIPGFSFEYFDPKDEQVKTLTSEPIAIEVEGSGAAAAIGSGAPKSGQKAKPAAKSESPSVKAASQSSFWLGFFAGAGAVAAAAGLWWLLRKRERGGRLSLGDRRELLRKLLPYIADDPRAAKMARALYGEIYEGRRKSVSKKEIKKLLEDLVQRRRPLHPRS
jgi:hypothetical protein